MIHGVLVERTIQDVLPALQTNSEGLKKVLAEMVKQYKSKQNEMDNWKVRTVLFFFFFLFGPVIVTTPNNFLQKKNHVQVVQP